MIDFKYKPDGEVLKSFMKDDTFFRGIRGPLVVVSLLRVALRCSAGR